MSKLKSLGEVVANILLTLEKKDSSGVFLSELSRLEKIGAYTICCLRPIVLCWFEPNPNASADTPMTFSTMRAKIPLYQNLGI